MIQRATLAAIVFVSIALAASGVLAGYVVEDAQIARVLNTGNNDERFMVLVTGGRGVCADRYLSFYESNAGSREVHRRAFAMALTAFATRTPVNIFSFQGDDCDSPAFIMIGR